MQGFTGPHDDTNSPGTDHRDTALSCLCCLIPLPPYNSHQSRRSTGVSRVELFGLIAGLARTYKRNDEKKTQEGGRGAEDFNDLGV